MMKSLILKPVIVNIIIQPQKQPQKSPQKLRRLKKSTGRGTTGVPRREMTRTRTGVWLRLRTLKNKTIVNCAAENVTEGVEKFEDALKDFGGNVGHYEKFEKLGGDCK